jgi:hypothetical protein
MQQQEQRHCAQLGDQVRERECALRGTPMIACMRMHTWYQVDRMPVDYARWPHTHTGDGAFVRHAIGTCASSPCHSCPMLESWAWCRKKDAWGSQKDMFGARWRSESAASLKRERQARLVHPRQPQANEGDPPRMHCADPPCEHPIIMREMHDIVQWHAMHPMFMRIRIARNRRLCCM